MGAGITTDSVNGSVEDKFATTISIINGANECSPENKPPDTTLTAAQAQEVTLLFKTKSATRYLYYIKILTEELGVLPSELTSVERDYSLITPAVEPPPVRGKLGTGAAR